MPDDLHSRSAMFTDFPCHDSLAMQRATARNRKFINIGVTPISLYFVEGLLELSLPCGGAFIARKGSAWTNSFADLGTGILAIFT